MEEKKFDVCVVGSGMGALTTACLLARDGKKVAVLEQNWIPGGCTSSYWRKGFVFECGATTLVGLDPSMPLHHLLQEIGIEIPTRELSLPMKVWMKNHQAISRFKNLDEWITEAERVFGSKNQRPFWEFCKKISDFVWETSLQQTHFPPTRLNDLWQSTKRANFKQLKFAGYAFMSMDRLLKKYGLLDNQEFVDFVNEQLLITAQNHIHEVNALFGATALCYTNYGNHYVDGGLINLVNPLVNYLEQKGSQLFLRTEVQQIERNEKEYIISTKKQGKFSAEFVVSGIPINNTVRLFGEEITHKYQNQVLSSKSLNSAFQMGIGFKRSPENLPTDCIHHQIHLEEPLPQVGAASIFLSLNHPEDTTRTDEANHSVASISTHIPDPENNIIADKKEVEAAIIDKLATLGFLRKSDIVYQHSSTPKSWQKWTGREWGFVGGYPQFMRIKPWQMLDARLDHQKAYICGDTTYPGQGIPGVVLSGIVAYEKLKSDWS